MQNNKMSVKERNSTVALASIFAFRMLGLFMILPVFTLYAHTLNGATPLLIGIAIGIYGITQALLQIPFGILSDHIGRKPVIIIGLIIFAIGSVIAANSHTIQGIIIGRAIQGAGAIGSTILALVSDLTREEHRTKAMAIIGMVIGASFSLAMILGPIINSLLGGHYIFWSTAILAMLGLFILHKCVPTPEKSIFHRDIAVEKGQFLSVIRDPQLLRLDFGILAQHAILTATFVVLPVILQHIVNLSDTQQWCFYLPILVLSFLIMVPLIIIAETKNQMKTIFVGAIASIVLSQLGLIYYHNTFLEIGICLLVFFIAFNLLEASLPSLISKIAPPGSKGTATGVYSCSQFLGIALGGTMGGWLYGTYQLASIFLFCAAMATIWLLVAATMKRPRSSGTFMIKVGQVSTQQANELTIQLLKIAGVLEAVVMTDDGIAYLKVDNSLIDKQNLLNFSSPTQ